MRNGLRAFMKKTILVVQIAFALLAAPAFAGNDKNFTYLALGDSIPFGMNILLLPPYTTQLPTPFDFTGYPETVAAAEHLLTSKKEVNASCPGETSGSFLDVNSPDLGCNTARVEGNLTLPPFKPTLGLRADYKDAQMAFVDRELAANKHIDLITLSIGANDVLMTVPALEVCGADMTCQQNVLNPVLDNYVINLTKILTHIRAKYTGQLVLLQYYSPIPIPLFDGLAQAINSRMAAVGLQAAFAPVRIIDGFTAFKTASSSFGGNPCAAGLLIKLPDGTCDVHPSPAGRDLLATIIEVGLR